MEKNKSEVIFNLVSKDARYVTYELIANGREVIERLATEDGRITASNILSKEQAIAMAKCILKYYGEI